MINQISFFTPVLFDRHKTFPQQIQEGIDQYFSFCGKTAYVIPGSVVNNSLEVILKDRPHDKVMQVILGAIKIFSYMTVVIPLILLAAKAVIRFTHHFHTVLPQTNNIEEEKTTQEKTSALAEDALGVSYSKTDTTFSSSLEGKNVEKSTLTTKEDKPSENKTSNLSTTSALPSDTKEEASESEEIIIGATSKVTKLKSAAENAGITVASLMAKFTASWNAVTKNFDFSEYAFDLKYFTEHLSDHANKFKKEEVNKSEHFGYIEKFDLNPAENPYIYMRADLHGDLKSLIENLRSLKEQGLLDESFKCKPGMHLVFLGDYCDRGVYGTEILELLMLLREENPTQVHLIRGNHEYRLINGMFGASDLKLKKTLSDGEAKLALESFYETMSLTTYFSVTGEEPREYVQCTHGLFEPSMDPSPLLDQKPSGTCIPVTKQRVLSERICKIAEGDSKLGKAAKQISDLVKNSKHLEDSFTAYNWADVSENDSYYFGGLSERKYALGAKDIRRYLDLSSVQHKVMMVFRGHQHQFQHLLHKEKVLVTTLPVGMDSSGYQGKFNQPDRAYIIQPHAKVENWLKQAILRETGHAITDTITESHPLTSSAV